MMDNNYIIFADTACDVSLDIPKALDLRYIQMSFTFGDDGKEYTSGDIAIKDFYDGMRSGKVSKTSAINLDGFVKAFRPVLESGSDIFYLAFSSGLSSTYMNAASAADELKEDFPERKIIVVDSLAASGGYGLLLYLCLEKKRSGADMAELKAYAEGLRLNICHWFTVEDLVYLKRGGRISAATAIAGAVLGIKPILHVDDEGHLINMSKVRGRKASIRALADKFGELSVKEALGTQQTVLISHADCQGDAKTLADILKKEYSADVRMITGIGPIIGAHSGPGTLALFFIGKKR